jgi:acyl carrier protein
MHDELLAAIADWNPALPGPISRHTPLITSACLDSLGLLKLLVWIEQRVGRPIDVTAIDMVKEWDSVNAIVSFVEREHGSR